jgi:hypothetical protein
MTVIPSGVLRASIIRCAVAVKVVRFAPPPVTATRLRRGNRF